MEARRHATSGIKNAALGIAKPALLVGATALASRVLGFVRDMLMAWLLGGGPAADALVVALRVPHVVRRLLGEGSLSMALTACLVRYRQQYAEQTQSASPTSSPTYSTGSSRAIALDTGVLHGPSFALAWAISIRIALLLGVIIIGAEVAARPLIACLAPGLTASPATIATAEQATYLLRICLPYAFAAGMAALGMAFLHSINHFLLPALSPLCFNVIIIAFALLAATGVGSPATMLACGFLAGGLCQWLLPCLALWRMGVWQHRKPAPPNAVVQHCLRSLPAGLMGTAAPQVAMLCAMAVASFLPSGTISALYYAERLLELPMSVSGTALGMVSVPILTALATSQQHDMFARHCATALRLSLLVALPAAAGLLAVAQPLVSVLFGHGAFDQHAVRQTALALSAYSCSLPLYAISRPLLAACTARKLSRIIALSGVCAVLVSLVAAVALCQLLPTPYAVLGPPLAVGLALAAQCCVLWYALRASVTNLGIFSPAIRILFFASLLTFGVARSVTLLCPNPASALVLGIFGGVVTYGLSLLFLKHEDTKAFIQWCKARCKRTHG